MPTYHGHWRHSGSRPHHAMVDIKWIHAGPLLMVIDEGQQYGTDREIRLQPSACSSNSLILWTGDAQQTLSGIARTAPNAKRSRQLLLAKKHGLRSDRNYYMPSNLAEAMIRLLDDSSNEGLHLLNQTLRNSEHVLGECGLSNCHQLMKKTYEQSTKSSGP